MANPDLRPPTMRQERAREMLRRHLAGWNNQQIARFLGCTDRWVRAELADMPLEEQRQAVRGSLYAQGEISMEV